MSHKTSLSNIPPAPLYHETVCEIDIQRKALIQEAHILKQHTHQITTGQNAEAKNYKTPHEK